MEFVQLRYAAGVKDMLERYFKGEVKKLVLFV